MSARDVRIPLAAPEVDQETIEHVARVLGDRTLSIGPRLEAFEKRFARSIGTRFALGVNSGTSGLHLALRVLEVGPGDEVVTTPFSFVASANCALFVGARPVFVDVEPETLVLDVGAADAVIGPRTRAVLPVHVFGYPVDMPRLLERTARHDLAIVEDACEAVGGTAWGRRLGSFGDVGVFGFYPNKQMTTGEGGMVVTDHEELAQRIGSLRNQGRSPDGDGRFVDLGYNYRMSEITAALGEKQLERLDGFVAARRRVEARYHELLGDIEELRLMPRSEKRSPFVFVVRASRPELREHLRRHLAGAGIQSAVYFRAIHLEPYYRDRFGHREGEFPITERAAETCLALPFFTRLGEQDQKEVASAVKEGVASWLAEGTVSAART